MNHPANDELADLLKDRHDDPKTKWVSDHVNACDRCQDRLEQIIQTEFSSVLSADTLPTLSLDTLPGGDSSTDSQLPKFGLGSRFLIIEEIARGGMGIVYRALDRELVRQVAVKVAQLEQGRGEARFKREAQISAQLQHPGIIPVYQTGKLKDSRSFIVMKLVEGQTLLNSIHSEPNNLRKHLAVFGKICQTMAFAHSKNCIHRDLKPENVMIGNTGEVLVMDWGLAKRLNAPNDSQRTNCETDATGDQDNCAVAFGETVEGEVFGTPAYMSPEQAIGGQTGKQADVFALGGILHEIITGRAPFSKPNSSKAVDRSNRSDLEQTFSLLDQAKVNDKLVSLTKACLAPDPGDRPRNAVTVSKQFASLLTDRKERHATAKLEQARAQERSKAARNRTRQLFWFVIALSSTLVGAAIAGGLYWAERSQRETSQRTMADEIIQTNLANARRLSALANAKGAKNPGQNWQAALREIKQANANTKPISDSLQIELKELTVSIQNESTQFFVAQDRIRKEIQCSNEVKRLCIQSLYPVGLREALFDGLADQFSAAYQEIDIDIGNRSDEILDRFRNSEARPYLMHGLLAWHQEIVFDVDRDETDSQQQLVRQWLELLLLECEKDSFRAEVLLAYFEKQYQFLEPMLQKQEAVSSLATVLLCTRMLGFLQNRKDKKKFLLKAQRAFPNVFEVKWKLASGDGDSQSTVGNSFRVVLACHALQPNNPAVMFQLGRIHVALKEFDLAIEQFQRVVEIAPNFVDGEYQLANAYFKNKQLEFAKEVCVKILEVEENHSEANLMLDQISEREDQLDDAASGVQKSISGNPMQADAHYRLAKVLRQQDKRTEALTHLKQAVEIEPTNRKYQTELCGLHVVLKNWEEAEAICKQMLKRNPADHRTIATLANQYLQRKLPEKSEALIRKALLNGTNHHLLQIELAKALLAQKVGHNDKRDEAIVVLKQLLASVPNHKAAAYHLEKELRELKRQNTAPVDPKPPSE